MSSPFYFAPAAEPAIELNPGLDRALCAAVFRKAGRVHIPQILTDAAAQRLHRCLREETAWSLTYNKGEENFNLAGLSAEQRRSHAGGAWERARNEFQYFYDTHRLTHQGEPYAEAKHYLSRLVNFLNMPEFISFARYVTGLQNIVFADAQATLYRPGDFLTVHDDYGENKHRLAAYVLNLTPAWKADWGGVTQFLDEDGHVIEGYVPAYNALNIFRVPQRHLVSQVALFGSHRYSVTGWLRARK